MSQKSGGAAAFSGGSCLELAAAGTTSDARIAELTAIVKTFERILYGTHSERLRGARLDDDQIDFVFDEIETGVAATDAELETAANGPSAQTVLRAEHQRQWDRESPRMAAQR
jgi:hypothetical protein